MSDLDKKGYVKPPINPHNEPYVDDLNSLLESLHEHDDRSLILTMAAFAEDTVGQLLLNYFREPKQAKELVTGFNAPLGTFSARIKIALVLGLMEKDDYLTLEILRKIRNQFAHNWKGVSFDREDIASLISKISISKSQELLCSESEANEIPARLRVVQKVTEVLIRLRMLSKTIHKRGIKPSIIIGDWKPYQGDIVEVDEVPPK